MYMNVYIFKYLNFEKCIPAASLLFFFLFQSKSNITHILYIILTYLYIFENLNITANNLIQVCH